MALFKKTTSPNGIPVEYHRIIKAELLGDSDTINVQVGSWVSEESFVSGAPAAWNTYTGVTSNNLYVILQTQLLQTQEFEQAAVLVETEPLAVLQQRKWLQIKTAQNTQEYGGFLFEGVKFDSDLASQTKIQGAALQATQDPNFSVTWTLADNSTKFLNAEQLVELNKALIAHIEQTHAHAQELRTQIYAAVTPETLDQITW